MMTARELMVDLSIEDSLDPDIERWLISLKQLLMEHYR